MKKLLNILSIFSFTLLSFPSIAQQGMLTSEEGLVGDASEFLIGIHTGLFDCNQTIKYPYNIGVLAQYNYIPDVTKKLFIGGELGAFYSGSKADDYGRKTRVTLADITVYPGLSFPVGANLSSNDNTTRRLKKLSKSRKLSVGLGFTVAIPLHRKSEGSRVNTEAIKPGLGFSIRTSFDLPNRLTLFGHATRIGRDLDGYSNYSINSIEPSSDNEKNATYYYKLGLLWNFLGK